MGSMSLWHWLVVVVVACLFLGGERLRGLGKDLGNAIRDFQSAIKEKETPQVEASVEPPKEGS